MTNYINFTIEDLVFNFQEYIHKIPQNAELIIVDLNQHNNFTKKDIDKMLKFANAAYNISNHKGLIFYNASLEFFYNFREEKIFDQLHDFNATISKNNYGMLSMLFFKDPELEDQ